MKWMFGWILVVMIGMNGCKPGPGSKEDTSYQKGTLHISCDESFKPVIDEEIKVYTDKFPGVNLLVHYKPEAECLHDLVADSVDMVIATRGTSPGERKMIRDSLLLNADQATMARDLVALVVNPAAKDTMFSLQEIRDLLSGKTKENLIPVFDGKKATSTVRFMLDSVLKGEKLSEKAVAAQSSLEVLDYVSKVPNAVGFVGFSWVGNMDDTTQRSFRKKIRLAWVESTDSAGAYVHPSQYFIYTATYPMVRDLVYVVKEKSPGLGHAFTVFLTGDRGQLIFKRAYLMPVVRPNYIRNAELNEKSRKD